MSERSPERTPQIPEHIRKEVVQKTLAILQRACDPVLRDSAVEEINELVHDAGLTFICKIIPKIELRPYTGSDTTYKAGTRTAEVLANNASTKQVLNNATQFTRVIADVLQQYLVAALNSAEQELNELMHDYGVTIDIDFNLRLKGMQYDGRDITGFSFDGGEWNSITS